jgi:hypothetical protein
VPIAEVVWILNGIPEAYLKTLVEHHEVFEESRDSKPVPPKNEAEVAAITLFLQLNL